jgi:hypothetical protein
MSARDLAIVLLRVAGVYLLIHVLTALPATLWSVGSLVTSSGQTRSVVAGGIDWQDWKPLVFTIWPVVVYAAATIGLLVGAPRMATRLVRVDAEPGRVVLGRRLQAVLFTAVGVSLLAGAAPRVATTALTLAMTTSAHWTPIPGTITDTVQWPALLELGVSLGVGLYLCLGARGLSNAIQMLRDRRRTQTADGE